MIFVEPMESWHIDEFLENPRDYDKSKMGDKEAMRTNMNNLLSCTMGESFFTQDAKLVALWFIAQRDNGKTAVIFSYMTAEIDKHPVNFIKACRMSIDTLHEALNIDRVEAFVDKDYAKSIRWLEFMGFRQEGPLEEHEITTISGLPIDMVAQVGYIVMGRCW